MEKPSAVVGLRFESDETRSREGDRATRQARVRALLGERLERDVAVAVESQQRTQSAATHEESKPENDEDTRVLDSSYLGRGQAQRGGELGAALTRASALQLRRFGAASPVAVSALIGVRRCLDQWFRLPRERGAELESLYRP